MKPVHATLRAPCPADQLFRWVEDLSRYPQWLDLVQRADALGDDRWTVVLAAQLGPLRRSKQLTMVRTECEPGRRVRFERLEPDGRHHAAWVLQAEVTELGPDGPGGPAGTAGGAVTSELTMTMSYDGQWWGPLIESVLGEQIDRARPRLLALLAG